MTNTVEHTNKKRPIRAWLSELPDGYRERALSQLTGTGSVGSMEEAIRAFAFWEGTYEKGAFWSAVRRYYSEDHEDTEELPPLTQHVYELKPTPWMLINRALAGLRSRRAQPRAEAVMQVFDVTREQAEGICTKLGYKPNEILPPFEGEQNAIHWRDLTEGEVSRAGDRMISRHTLQWETRTDDDQPITVCATTRPIQRVVN